MLNFDAVPEIFGGSKWRTSDFSWGSKRSILEFLCVKTRVYGSNASPELFEYIWIFILGDRASVDLGDPFFVWHRTYSDTGTVQDQFELWIVRSSISIIYLELGSLFMLNCFLTTCNSRRRPSICKFKFRSVCVTCESRCQHESIDSIVKTESNSNRTICG